MSKLSEPHTCDVLVVGSGGAGLRAAIEASDLGASTTLVSNGGIGESGATMLAGADYTLDGGGAAKIGLEGNEKDSKERLLRDIVIQGYYLNNQRLVDAYVRDAPSRAKELIDWGVKYHWNCEREIRTQGTEINRVLVDQVGKRSIVKFDDVFVTDLLSIDKTVVGAFGVDVNRGVFKTLRAKAVVIATGGWQRAYSFASAPGGLTGGMHAAAYRVGADLVNMEMVTFCPNVILKPPAFRGDIFPYVLSGRFGELLDRHGRQFLRDEYEPLIYRIATTTEWNKLIYSLAATRVALRGDGSPAGGVYYSIKSVPLNIVDEAEKIYPGWKWLRTNYSELMNWLKDGNAVEVASAAHYMEGGIRVDEHATTTVKGLYAAGECSGGLFGANRVASAITQILVQGAIAGKSAANFAKKADLQDVNKDQLEAIESRLTEPFTREKGVRPMDLKKRIRKIADKHLWVIRDGNGIRQAIAELQLIVRNELPRISIQTKTRIYNKEWIDAIELEGTLIVLEASARSALYRTESRGVHYRSDYPRTNNNRWLNEIIVRKVNGKMGLRKGPLTVTRVQPPKGKFSFEDGILQAVRVLSK